MFELLAAFFVALSPAWSSISVERVEENRIYFTAPSGGTAPAPLTTQLHGIAPIGAIDPEGAGESFIIVGARSCKDCEQDSELYLLKPSGGKPTAFIYPGKVIDSKTRTMLIESRAFFGKCVPPSRAHGDALVIYQNERIERRGRVSTHRSVYLAEPTDTGLREKMIEKGLPSIDDTLKRVRKKQCQEIEGRNRMTK